MSDSDKSKSKLMKLLPNGDGVVHYASGNLAVIICKQASGQLITFMSDHSRSKVLANFNHLGEGAINFASGKPWIVVTSDGYIVSDRKGDVVERGKWPRTNPDPIVCSVDDSLVVTFKSKQDISAHFSHEDVNHIWQCGESLRRTDLYTAGALGSRNGKLDLDVNRIRERQQSTGNLYVSPGPRQQSTELPGVGSLKVALRNPIRNPQLGGAIDDLRVLDYRMTLVSTLPPGMSSTSRNSAGSSSSLRRTRSIGGGNSLSATGGGGAGTTSISKINNSSISNNGMSDATSSSTTATRVHLDDAVSLDESGRLSDYGKPVLSDVQRQYKHTMRTPNPNTPAVNYQLRRTHLPRLDIDRTGKWQARVLGESSPVDTVVLLCVLAGYDPLCSRVEPQLEMAWFEIVEATAATPSADLAHVVMWRVEASQDRILQEMYGFRSVPMFLMFYEGAMVWGGNTIRSAEDARRVAMEALIRGRRKDSEGTAVKGGLGGGVNDSTILEGVIDEEALAKKVRGIPM